MSVNKRYHKRTLTLIYISHNAKIGFHGKKHEDYLKKIATLEDLDDYLKWLTEDENYG